MRRVLACLLLVALVLPPAVAFGCPNCKDAIANQAQSEWARAAQGYDLTIYFMVALPFTLLAGVAGSLIWATARAERAARAAEVGA